MKYAVIGFGVFSIALMMGLDEFFIDSSQEGRSMSFMFTFAVMFVNSILCFIYAGKLDRNKLGWGAAGLFFPMITNLVLAFMSPQGGGAVPVSVISFLLDKTVCLGCGTVHPSLKPGKVCQECGDKVLGFYAGTYKQVCDTCAASLSDEPITQEKRMGLVMQERGLRCSKCFKLLCYECSGVGQHQAGATCDCDGNLEIRI